MTNLYHLCQLYHLYRLYHLYQLYHLYRHSVDFFIHPLFHSAHFFNRLVYFLSARFFTWLLFFTRPSFFLRPLLDSALPTVQCLLSSPALDGGADLRKKFIGKNSKPLKRWMGRPQLLPEIVENVLRSLWWGNGSKQPSPCLQPPKVGGLLRHLLLLLKAPLTSLHF